ncbi:uncharacterized protein LAESUDRAFT_716212 [Laetiporus sulphureus 93-53]|uniref:DUF6532 domain-containing protein n=1 Tax=Laetiporus sulphureus 93-53 TaxID=1314785 RepID=A0A165CSY5_9APHY|nr:uncharacterized protein LAESUDRAFT_716212 [Laetiporus sulphureus 93-53]KZT03382.1 hypothetical protein LAESUDRAFT_716212 [Laetiporus sulphureus 93-53]
MNTLFDAFISCMVTEIMFISELLPSTQSTRNLFKFNFELQPPRQTLSALLSHYLLMSSAPVHRTRATNALKHPGLVVASTPRRTTAQVQADKKREDLKKQMKVDKRKRAIEAVAEVEAQMEEEDEHVKAKRITKRVATEPSAKSKVKTNTSKALASKKTGKGSLTEPESDLTDLPSEDEPPPKKSKKDSGTRVVIEQARLELLHHKLSSSEDIGSEMATIEHPAAASQNHPIKLGGSMTDPTLKTDFLKDVSFDKLSQAEHHSKRQNDRVLVRDRGFASESDEDIECFAALSSPVKGPNTRLTHKNMIKIDDVDDIDATPFAKPSAFKFKSFNSQEVADVDDTPQPIRTRKTRDTYVNVEDTVTREAPSVIKTEPSDTAIMNRLRPSRQVGKSKTSDLPDGANTNGRWYRVFLPTLRRYAGTLVNPWIIKDEDFIHALQMIWNAIYGKAASYTVVCNDHVFKLATQRLSEWRSGFGQTALRLLDTFFADDKENLYNTIEDRRDFAEYMLSKLRFTYEHAEGNNKAEWTGLYQSVFILRLLAYHYTHMKDAIDVPGLTGMRRHEDCPIGAIAMSSAATYRALLLWVKGDMALENGKGILLKSMNVATGDATNSETAFSEAKYGTCTVGYAEAARKLGIIKPKKMTRIVERAMKIAFAGKSIGRREIITIDDSDLDSDEDPSKLVDLGPDSDAE